MLYYIKVKRGGIGEEDYIFHHKFEERPTREEIIQIIKDKDIGYDNNYCDFDFYLVN